MIGIGIPRNKSSKERMINPVMSIIRTPNAANSSVRAGSAAEALIGRHQYPTIRAGDHAKEVRKLLSPIASEGGRQHRW